MKTTLLKLLANLWAGILGTLSNAWLDYVLPAESFLNLALVLVIADTATGIYAAGKRKEVISIKYGARRFLEKIILFWLAILLSEGMQFNFTFLSKVPIVEIAAFTICVHEFESVISNIGNITGVDIWAKIKGLIQRK